MKKNFLTYLFVLLQISVFSQSFHTTNISISEGLFTNEVYDIFQDKSGNMWFATDLGVCKYDGYEFQNFTTKNGLTHNVVFQIREYDSRLYFNTYKGGICYLEKDTILPYKYNQKLLAKTAYKFVLDFIIEKGKLWFNVSNENGLHSINQKGEIEEFNYKDKESTFYIKEIGERKICGFANQNLQSNKFRVNQEEEVFITTPTIKLNLILRPQILESYFAYGKNLINYSQEKINKTKLLDKDISALYKSKGNNLWVGTYGGGVLYYENAMLNSTPKTYLSGKTISDIFEDNQGNIWFSTTETGVYYFDTHKSFHMQLDEKVMVLRCSGSNVFCGTDNGNVYKISGNTKELIYTNPSGFAIKDIHLLDSSHVLVNYKIINHFSKKQTTYNSNTTYLNNIYTNHGEYFVTAYNGFQLFNRASDLVFDSYQEGFKDRVRKAVSFSPDSLLVLSNSGLYLFSDNKILKVDVEGVDELEITSICKWRNQLLISTKNNGIIFLDSLFQPLQVLSKNSGLSSDNCLSVYVNKNTVLIGTNIGLDVVSETENGFSIQQFNTSNLLYNSKINCISSFDDKMVVGTDYGIEVFKDSKFEYEFNPIQITTFKVNDIPQNEREFRYNQNNIDIFFVSPNYGEEVSYRYRLAGATNKWSITQNNSIKYSQLSPGNYEFEVQPFVNNQFGDLTAVKFTIKSHFTNSWWFFFVIGLLVLWVIYLIIMDMKIKEKYKREAIQSTQKALRAQMNPHFLFNALNSIQSYIFSNEKELSVKYLNKFSSLVRKVLDNSMHDYITIKEDLSALEDYMQLEKIRFEDNFEYEISIDEQLDINNCFIPPLLLQPVVENAIWHGLLHKTDKNGKITISLSLENNTIVCAIIDNGVGRKRSKELEKTKTHKSVGIQITKERLKVINTKSKQKIYLQLFDLNPEQSETGTKVKIILPIIEK